MTYSVVALPNAERILPMPAFASWPRLVPSISGRRQLNTVATGRFGAIKRSVSLFEQIDRAVM